MKDLEHVLAEHPFFHDLAPEHRALIAGCGRLAAHAPGDFLMRVGEPADSFLLIRHGRVALELPVPGRDPFVFETATAGEVVGTSWLFPPHVTLFDVRAVDAVRVLRFDGACLRGKCDADARLGYDLMKRFAQVLVRRFHDTRLQLMDVHAEPR
jgi:CRP/FNR family transcriptional regulator, cyclic AMP receptor protein